MINLSSVTLVAADSLYVQDTLLAMNHCLKKINFFDKILFTDNETRDDNIRIEKIEKIKNINDYNVFMLKKIINYIKTDYVLIIQYDGFILNENSWENNFLLYDYIGAPWADNIVGNGGFCLRSTKLMKEVSNLPYDGSPEDVFICRTNKQHLENMGFKFAPLNVANKFSVENSLYKGQFGFHGKGTYLLNKQFGVF